MEEHLLIHPEVAEALETKQPVVALESTIIAHGLPYPENKQTAWQLEKVIREAGAVPATIAIIDGKVKIGLDTDDLELIASEKVNVIKVSRRDLPLVIARKQHGATTVAATMLAASWVGIRVFVTGGIGGVHRNGENTLDISADLTELAKTNVAVVCAGAKSILDLGLTLEYLETQGVPVVGFQTAEFPAFYSAKSSYRIDRVENVELLAKALKTKWDLGLEGGMIIANPIPPKYEIDHQQLEEVTKDALQDAARQNIRGKAVTPFLLSRIKELTQGESLEANQQLVYHNARLGAELAVELASI
ncbi:pseudouridine-5'-phosphate glycosidase [Microscilla marina]|uniref:Pseudouridine-5'-phosphate glycosidase n=1 Tax=Microscilla marina ATCC 23134 TaxID=313606 RepID=A1ZZP4_MICM2|nr:pseudouridine-5'-phosphate glycosidase [Microscilla marina]EAY24152.1 indigoidine synthase A like protein [Microscilla marina ATCC 23134]